MLINRIEELKAILGGIQKTMAWGTWEPYVRQAEMKYIIPAVGADLHAELTAVTQPTEDQRPLLDRLKAATAYFAYLEALPFLATSTGDAGLLINAPSNTSNTPKWLFVTLSKDLASKSDFWLEDSLAWLETHAAAFPTWTESDAYTVSYGRLIASAGQLTRAFPSAKNSRRLFLDLRQYLVNSEEAYIPPILGEDFLASLLNKLVTVGYTFTPKEANVLRLVRVALANHAFAMALPFINLNTDFRYVSETDGIVNEDELDTPRINIIMRRCQDDRTAAVKELTDYLNAHASTLTFPEYFASDRYRPAPAAKRTGFPNDPANTFFAL